MLHHHHRIADIAKILQRAYQALIVSLVQTDARLVQNVEHVHELRTYLRGKSDSLALASGQRGRLSVERQIVQSDIQQKLYACAYLLEYLRSNGFLAFVQMLLRLVQPSHERLDVHVGKL